MSAKQKARKKKKGATKRQKQKQGFKRSGPEDTFKLGVKHAENNKQKITPYDMGKTICLMKITCLRKQGKLGI